MSWSEHTIARAISTQLLQRRCLLLVDRCNWTGHECDVLGVTTDLRIIDVEVKISRADLKADAKKDKWWQRLTYAQAKERGVDMWSRGDAREHPPKVWKHYYALPKGIWKPDLLDCLPSKASGVLLLHDPEVYRGIYRTSDPVWVQCIRRATPAKDAYRLKPEQVVDIARLANLRMWDAYAQAEQAERDQRRQAELLRAMTGGLPS